MDRGPRKQRFQGEWGGSSEQTVRDCGAAVADLLDEWFAEANSIPDRLNQPGNKVFSQLEQAADRLKRGVDIQSDLVRSRLDELYEESRSAATHPRPARPNRKSTKRKGPAERAKEERERRREALNSFGSTLYGVQNALDELLSYLHSDQIKAAITGSVLLVGEAGCGKSHLVADLAKERVAADLPSFLMLGQVLVTGPLAPQLVSLLGLGSMTFAEVLQAVDVAARVRRNGRALLVVDAINEGAGADLWEHQLRGFVADVARYDWVALVITVRDVYENAVAPSGVGDIVRSVHHGLAGHEEEALTLYANLYGLRLPDIPALLPELSNPLFLRSMCQSVQGRGLKEIPRESASLVWVFDGLIRAIDETLRHPSKLNYGDWEQKVPAAVNAIASLMVDSDSESLPLPDASKTCLAIHDDQRNSHSLLNGLIVEGLLLRERVDRDGVATEAVRFTYQRLSDHLRADVLLGRSRTDRELAATVRAIARSPHPWAMSGVIEALVLLVPERRGKELATVLRLGRVATREYRYGERDSPTMWLRYEVQSAFFDTLMWRSPSTFTPATKDLLNRYLKAGVIDEHDWLRIITGLACVPGHPLNMDWLDPILGGMSLPVRDAAWSRALLWLYSEDSNPIGRTIDWAWSNPDAPDDVVRLAAVFLSWLLTSSNRRLRDTATKALVSVTSPHTERLVAIVERFADVNDPYVLDRVLAAVYGHVLRRRHHPQTPESVEALSRLGEAVFDAVFIGDATHLMLRHRARSCVRIIDDLCRAAGREFGRDVTRADPPYSSSCPLRAPSARRLAQGFGRDYSGYLGSATELDWEFRETIERRVVADLALPNQEQLRSSRRRALTRQREALVAALMDVVPASRAAGVRRRADALMMSPASPDARYAHLQRRDAWDAFEARLSTKARERAKALRASVEALERLDKETFHPDPDLCIRWVAARVLDLGWTKERFGAQDRALARRSGEQVNDRIAKKYERIAFQELCGHLSDHCLIDERSRRPPEPYSGPWQISEALDLDPSLLVRGDQPDSDTPAARLRSIRLRAESEPTWWRTFADHRLSSAGSDEEWLSDISDIPRPERLLRAADPAGREWVAIERHQQWSLKDPINPEVGYQGERRILWFRSQANIIRAGDDAHPPWAANQNWMGLSAVSTAQDVWMANLGEYPDVAPWPLLLDEGDRERRPYYAQDDPGTDTLPWGWELAHVDDLTQAPYALATTWCHQDSARDFSANDTPIVMMPSRILLGLLEANWSAGRVDMNDLGLGPVEREYSWMAGGQVVAFCESGREFGSRRALWVRADTLRDALENNGLALWSWTLGEKIYWKGHEPSSNRADCFSAVRLAPGPLTVWGYTIERDRGRARSSARQRVLVERAPGIPDHPTTG